MPLSRHELQEFLAKRLPAASDVPPDASTIEVLSRCSGKRLVVLPEQARELLLQEFGFPHRYRDFCAGGNGAGPDSCLGMNIGLALQTIIESLAPVTGNWSAEHQGAVLAPSREGQARPPTIPVVLVTRRHLMLVCVPRDVEYSLPTPHVADPKAAKWRDMEQRRRDLREQWRALDKDEP